MNPISIGCAKRPPGRWETGTVKEICGRDFLTLVLRIGNSNENPGIEKNPVAAAEAKPFLTSVDSIEF